MDAGVRLARRLRERGESAAESTHPHRVDELLIAEIERGEVEEVSVRGVTLHLVEKGGGVWPDATVDRPARDGER